MALACGGVRFVNHLPCDLKQFCRTSHPPFHLEFILTPHVHDDSNRKGLPPIFGSGIEIDTQGNAKKLRKTDYRLLPPDVPNLNLAYGTGNTAYFFLGYRAELKAHDRMDRFDFTDPFFRTKRFHSLFDDDSRITDPAAFLTRLNQRAIRFSRFPAKHTLETLCKLFEEYLSVETVLWTEKKHDLKKAWSALFPWQQRTVLPILDAVRHMMDAFPRRGNPLTMPGLILLDRPDRFCTQRVFPLWIELLDLLMPEMQFVLTLSDKSRLNFPGKVKKRCLSLPRPPEPPKKQSGVRISRGTILLIDVDSRLPNLALMKLSRHFKEKGKHVILGKRDLFIRGAKAVYGSCVFYSDASQRRVKRLKELYGDSIILGGSGVDIRGRLPEEIDKLPPDYSLYPELEDRGIGFITRGCPRKCAFCIVPEKEGKPRQVGDLDSLIQKDRQKLILLDDNILAHPKAGDFLEQMASRQLKVNFTQTLDLRLVDKEKAALIGRIHSYNTRFTRNVYHFSLNDCGNLDLVQRKYRLFGFTSRDNVEFVCMYGYNTTLAEDVERFRFLRSLPGAYVFVQRYRPIPGGPTPDLDGFFDGHVETLIDELVEIVFPQNMKSMEVYYRWLSKRYVQTFGKLHERLVDTIFKYNNRDRKGHYIATMGGTLPRSRLIH